MLEATALPTVPQLLPHEAQVVPLTIKSPMQLQLTDLLASREREERKMQQRTNPTSRLQVGSMLGLIRALNLVVCSPEIVFCTTADNWLACFSWLVEWGTCIA